MARPCHVNHADLQPPGVCPFCDLGRDPESPHAKLWAGTAPPERPRPLCLHLGPVVPVESMRTHYRCERGHGTVCPCRHCGPDRCPDYEPELEPDD